MRSNKLKEMCIDVSMSIIEKVFHYEESELSVIKCKDKIWFRGKAVTEILRYTIQRKAICDHVDPEDIARFNELYGRTNCSPLKTHQNQGVSKTDPPLRMKWTP